MGIQITKLLSHSALGVLALIPFSLATQPAYSSSVSVTVCAQNDFNILASCTSNTDGSLLSATVNKSGINGNPNNVGTSTATAEGEVTSFGEFGVFASTDWNNQPNTLLTDSAVADATVNDVLHFSGISSGSISFTYTLDGSASATGSQAFDNSFWLILRSQQFGLADFSNDLNIPSSVTLTATFTGGTLAYSMQMEAAVRTMNALTLDESVDFLHTATLTGLQVFDSNGNPVNAGITADSGFAYPNGSSTAAPEPGTAPLAGLAAIGIAWIGKRKKRALR
jgi:hypothetical protein